MINAGLCPPPVLTNFLQLGAQSSCDCSVCWGVLLYQPLWSCQVPQLANPSQLDWCSWRKPPIDCCLNSRVIEPLWGMEGRVGLGSTEIAAIQRPRHKQQPPALSLGRWGANWGSCRLFHRSLLYKTYSRNQWDCLSWSHSQLQHQACHAQAHAWIKY